jgi:hypothetical protein
LGGGGGEWAPAEARLEGIEQRVWLATPDKRAKLGQVVAALQERSGRTLIFCEKKRTATWLKKMLRNGGPSDGGDELSFSPKAWRELRNSWLLTVRATTVAVVAAAAAATVAVVAGCGGGGMILAAGSATAGATTTTTSSSCFCFCCCC